MWVPPTRDCRTYPGHRRAVAVELVLGLRNRSRAGGQRTRVGGIHILQVQVQHGGMASMGRAPPTT